MKCSSSTVSTASSVPTVTAKYPDIPMIPNTSCCLLNHNQDHCVEFHTATEQDCCIVNDNCVKFHRILDIAAQTVPLASNQPTPHRVLRPVRRLGRPGLRIHLHRQLRHQRAAKRPLHRHFGQTTHRHRGQHHRQRRPGLRQLAHCRHRRAEARQLCHAP